MHCKIDPAIISYFDMFGFIHLTRIQEKATQIIFQKKDSLVIAPTGSGKTECSIIPIFYHIKKSKKIGKIKMLYVTPLKSLNRDVYRRITSYATAYDLSIEIRHGDTTKSDRIRISDHPPDILITTPETLTAFLIQKKMLNALSDLEWVVIDEIHELLNNERGTQLTLTLERLQLNSKFCITRIGLSATISNIKESAKFLIGTKRRYKIIKDKSRRQYDIKIKYINGTLLDSVKYIINFIKKMNLNSPVLLFTNTRAEAESIASIIKEFSLLNVELHHGSLSRQIREETEDALKKCNVDIVVCTSSMELGLDIDSIEFVVQYGSPKQTLKLIQRIGRSKHSVNSIAKGLIVTNNVDDLFESKAILNSVQRGLLEEQKIHTNSLDVLSHHMVGLTIQLGEVSTCFVYDTFVKAYPFRNLTLDNLFQIIDLLNSHSIIYFNKKKLTLRSNSNSFRYYFNNISTISDVLKFKVLDVVNKKIIGTLDQKFVAGISDYSNVFVLRGVKWRVINIDEIAMKVNAEPFKSSGSIPYWEGENIPIDYMISKQVGIIRTIHPLELFKFKSDTNLYFIPNEKTIVVESVVVENTIVLHVCFGTKINSTFATLLSSMISSLSGFIVESSSDAYRIIVSSKSRILKKHFFDVMYDEYDIDELIRVSIIGTHNLNWKTWCSAKKFGIIDKNIVYDKKVARFIYERYRNTPIVKEAVRELLHDRFDIKNLKIILQKIRDNDIEIRWCDTRKFSKLSEPILNRTIRYYSSPANIDEGILDLVKTRLFKNKHRLVCIRCGLWQKVLTTNDVPDKLSCSYCKSRQITATFYSDYELSKIIQKKHNGEKITAEENHKFNRAWKVSSLVETFGQTALIVLSGYGIGVDTAARILRNMVSYDILYKQIYQAERQYIITKGFWN